jgi:hypothetical protein
MRKWGIALLLVLVAGVAGWKLLLPRYVMHSTATGNSVTAVIDMLKDGGLPGVGTGEHGSITAVETPGSGYPRRATFAVVTQSHPDIARLFTIEQPTEGVSWVLVRSWQRPVQPGDVPPPDTDRK